ncbi:MAG: type II toxin-antitoxin system HicA family toxin [Bauldia sp.]|nr:type II toxin-antitoxin system HicA family toxin [Bauldia sp.]
MLKTSREICARLERDGWLLERVRGSHHVFRHPRSGMIVVVPHPRRDLGLGLVRAIYRAAGWEKD